MLKDQSHSRLKLDYNVGYNKKCLCLYFYQRVDCKNHFHLYFNVPCFFSLIICPSKTGRTMSCHQSVCPSVNFSCPFHNSDTVRDIFMKVWYKYKPPSDDVQRTRTDTPPSFLRNYGLLKFFLRKSCPLYNLDTLENVFKKLCTNVNDHQTMCREQEP